MNTFEQLLLAQSDVKVIDSTIPYSEYMPVSLAVDSEVFKDKKLSAPQEYEAFFENHLKINKARVAYGGYLEKRDLYQRSTVFNAPQTAERNIHIGLDLWIKAGTPVLAALDGVVHSFKNNTAWGDYGPTILLKHTLNNCEFYTLYGHLSLESIALLKINQRVRKGESIATLGSADVNGDYAPHLHFQLIKNIGNYQGDYPGVCSENDLAFYQHNCPDPNLLLKI